MDELSQLRQAIQRIVVRYPDYASDVRRAALGDRCFRDMCDDLAAALEMLRRLQARSDAEACPEISEYKTLILELESEIGDYLADLWGIDPGVGRPLSA